MGAGGAAIGTQSPKLQFAFAPPVAWLIVGVASDCQVAPPSGFLLKVKSLEGFGPAYFNIPGKFVLIWIALWSVVTEAGLPAGIQGFPPKSLLWEIFDELVAQYTASIGVPEALYKATQPSIFANKKFLVALFWQ